MPAIAVCRTTGLMRLKSIFPEIPSLAWEPRDHGLWRTQYGDLFVRDQWKYVLLLEERHTVVVVSAEFLGPNMITTTNVESLIFYKMYRPGRQA